MRSKTGTFVWSKSIFTQGISLILMASLLSPAYGQEGTNAEELAKKLSNPVASLISVPLQSNFEFGIGSEDAFRYVMNVQPVIPFSLNQDWNLISRTILPIIYQEEIFPGVGDEFGLGDTVQSLFLSPNKTDPFIWGAGPVFLIPTGTDAVLGGEQWGIGPTAVILKQQGPWTYGILANHIWSFAGDDDRADINATFLQPFLSYTTKDAWTYAVNTESTYDWENEQWTVPLLAGVSKLVVFKKQPVSIGINGRYFAEGPDSAPDWSIRFIVTLLFPKS